MVFSESLAGRVRDALERTRGITEKRMFGGLIFLLYGNILVGVRKDSMLARLSLEMGQEALSEPNVKPFENATRTMKGWVIVEGEALDRDQDLKRWIELALEFVSTLPRK